MKILPIATLLLAGTTMLWGRTWTSADGQMEFEGTFESFNAETNQVTVTIEGEKQEFLLSKLASADQDFIKAQAAPAEKTDVSELLGKATLSQLKDGKFTEATLEGTPDYYLVYFSASW